MTRKEFIYNYEGPFTLDERKSWGIHFEGGRKLYAVPCHCGEEDCPRWAMVSPELLGGHFELYYRPDEDKA